MCHFGLDSVESAAQPPSVPVPVISSLAAIFSRYSLPVLEFFRTILFAKSGIERTLHSRRIAFVPALYIVKQCLLDRRRIGGGFIGTVTSATARFTSTGVPIPVKVEVRIPTPLRWRLDVLKLV